MTDIRHESDCIWCATCIEIGNQTLHIIDQRGVLKLTLNLTESVQKKRQWIDEFLRTIFIATVEELTEKVADRCQQTVEELTETPCLRCLSIAAEVASIRKTFMLISDKIPSLN